MGHCNVIKAWIEPEVLLVSRLGAVKGVRPLVKTHQLDSANSRLMAL